MYIYVYIYIYIYVYIYIHISVSVSAFILASVSVPVSVSVSVYVCVRQWNTELTLTRFQSQMHNIFIRMTRLFHTYDMTHSYVVQAHSYV